VDASRGQKGVNHRPETPFSSIAEQEKPSRR
jgi:hypothetical protein